MMINDGCAEGGASHVGNGDVSNVSDLELLRSGSSSPVSGYGSGSHSPPISSEVGDSFVHICSLDDVIDILSEQEKLDRFIRDGQDIEIVDLDDKGVKILQEKLSSLDEHAQEKIKQLMGNIRQQEEKDIARSLENLGGITPEVTNTSEVAGFNLGDLLKIINFVKVSYYVGDCNLLNKKFSDLKIRSYQDPIQLREAGYTVTQFYNEYSDGTSRRHAGYVFIKDREITIAYRGTRTSYDCTKDIQISLTGSDAILPQGGKMHSGFYDLFRTSWSSLYVILKGYADDHKLAIKDFSLSITGHSMGGAVANIAALYLNQRHSARDLRVATFASPRVFDQDAAKFYENRLGDVTIRIDNKSDLVPSFPLGCTGYKHVGKRLVLNGNSLVNSHQVDVYRNLIINIEPENFRANDDVSRYYYFSYFAAACFSMSTFVPGAMYQALVSSENDRQYFDAIESSALLCKRIEYPEFNNAEEYRSYDAGDGFIGFCATDSRQVKEDIGERSPIKSDVIELSTLAVAKNGCKKWSSIKQLISAVCTSTKQPSERNHYTVLGFMGRKNFERELGKFVDSKIWEFFKSHMTNEDIYKSHKQVILQIVDSIIMNSSVVRDKGKGLKEIRRIKNMRDDQENSKQSTKKIGQYLNQVNPEEVFNELGRMKKDAEELFKEYREKTQGEYNRAAGPSCTELYKGMVDCVQSYEDLAKAKRTELTEEFLQECKSKKKSQPEQENAIKILADDQLRKIYNHGLEEGKLNQLASYEECRRLQNDLLRDGTEFNSHENTSRSLQCGDLDSYDVDELPVAGDTGHATSLDENSRAYTLEDLEEVLEKNESKAAAEAENVGICLVEEEVIAPVEENDTSEDDLVLMGEFVVDRIINLLTNIYNPFQRNIQQIPGSVVPSTFSTSRSDFLPQGSFFLHIDSPTSYSMCEGFESLVSSNSRLPSENSFLYQRMSGRIGGATNGVNLCLVKRAGICDLMHQYGKGDSTEESPMKVEVFSLFNNLVIGLIVADGTVMYVSPAHVRAVFTLVNYATHGRQSTVNNVGGDLLRLTEGTAHRGNVIYLSASRKNNPLTFEQFGSSFAQDSGFGLPESGPLCSPIPAEGDVWEYSTADGVVQQADRSGGGAAVAAGNGDCFDELSSSKRCDSQVILGDNLRGNGPSVATSLESKSSEHLEIPKGSEESESHVAPTVNSKSYRKYATHSTPQKDESNSEGNTHSAMFQKSSQSFKESKFSSTFPVRSGKDDKQNKQGRKWPIAVGSLLVLAAVAAPLAVHFVFATSLLATGIAAGAYAIVVLCYCYQHCREPASAPASTVDGVDTKVCKSHAVAA